MNQLSPIRINTSGLNNRFMRLLVLISMLCFLSGCGAMQKLTKRGDAQPDSGPALVNKDITSPPTVDDAANTAVETSPTDTISFEEWRAQREAEREAKAAAATE